MKKFEIKREVSGQMTVNHILGKMIFWKRPQIKDKYELQEYNTRFFKFVL